MPGPYCPSCGVSLPIVKVWQEGKTDRGGFSLNVKTGVVCPNCGKRLVILQHWAVVATVVAFLLYALLLFEAFPHAEEQLSHMSRPLAVLIALVAVLPVLGFESLISPHFSKVRPIKDGETADFPLDNNGSRDV